MTNSATAQPRLTARQRQRIDGLRGELVEARRSPERAARRAAARVLLARTVETWFEEHLENEGAYEREIAELNREAGFIGDDMQICRWTSPDGRALLMPPKFFGGDVALLDEDYVLSVSLNHAILSKRPDVFAAELSDQQAAGTMLSSCRDYFAQPYAYKRFFLARAKVLRTYASARGRPCAPEASWQQVNARWALYIERIPTRSRSCTTIPEGLAPSFVLALNAFVHDVLFTLAPPAVILLAGKPNRSVLPGIEWTSCGEAVRPDQTRNSCPVERGVHEAADGRQIPVVWCNFLRTINGPNSDPELQRLGELLAAVIDRPDVARADLPDR